MKWEPDKLPAQKVKKPFPAYPVFDMDFTLALADVAAEFFYRVAKENGYKPEYFVKKLHEYIPQTDLTIKAMEALGIRSVLELKKRLVPVDRTLDEKEIERFVKRGQVPVMRGPTLGYIQRNFLPYPGWAVEMVFREMLPLIKKGKLKLFGKPITRASLVKFAAENIRLIPGIKKLMQKISKNKNVGLRDCFIVTASLKPFAEGISLQLVGAHSGRRKEMVPFKNIYGLDFKTDARGGITGFKNYHRNEKLSNLEHIEESILEDLKKRGIPIKRNNPISHMLYIGDGVTDATAMRHINEGTYKGEKGNVLGGRGMAIAVHPQKKLLESGVVEFAVVAPDLSYLWNKLMVPFIENNGEIKSVRKQVGKGEPVHSSLLHRYEVYLGTKGAEPNSRLSLIAPWQREYISKKKTQKIGMWAKRYFAGVKRGFRTRR